MKKKSRIDKPIVKVEMLHYSKQHTSVRIARLMMESKKRDKTRYTYTALDQKKFFLDLLSASYNNLTYRINFKRSFPSWETSKVGIDFFSFFRV